MNNLNAFLLKRPFYLMFVIYSVKVTLADNVAASGKVAIVINGAYFLNASLFNK